MMMKFLQPGLPEDGQAVLHPSTQEAALAVGTDYIPDIECPPAKRMYFQ